MRTTLAIDDDLLAAASSFARDQERTLGQVISDLARKGLASVRHHGSRWQAGPKAGYGLAILAAVFTAAEAMGPALAL